MSSRILRVVRRVGVWRATFHALMRLVPAPRRSDVYHGLARLLGRIGVRDVSVRVNSTRLHVDPSDYFSLRSIVMARCYDEDQIQLVSDVVPKDRVFLDIGANFGVWTYSLAGEFPAVVCAEPDPRCVRCLLETQRDLHADSVTVFPGAISDRCGTAQLFFVDGHIGDSRIYDPHDGHRRGADVEMLTVDELLDRTGSDGARLFMKLDVQGYEPQVLRGMSRTLASAEDVILYTELTEDTLSAAGTSTTEYLAVLKELGFKPADMENGLVETGWPSAEEIATSKDWCFRFLQ